MNSLRKTSLFAGIFYLLTFVSIPAPFFFYAGVRAPNFIVGSGPDTPVFVGAVLEIIVALAGIGTAVVLYPVIKRQGQSRALGFVASRTLEAASITAGVVTLLSIVTLRQAGVGAAGLVVGQALAIQYTWMFHLSQSFIPVINAVLLGSLLYQSRLVPRGPSRDRVHRSDSAPRCLVRRPLRADRIGVRTGRHRRPHDRGVGVLAGRLPDLLGLQAVPYHG